ncbi:MAG: hypothetical protein F2899_03790, partial [Actinobacteria bacterium]|nr:hypothetical protein [Actinomycetota bacterium]
MSNFWIFNLKSEWAERVVRTLITVFILGLLQNAFAAPASYAVTAPPVITITGEDLETTFGEGASTTVSVDGGSIVHMGYNLSLSAQHPGITLRQIDTTTSIFSIDTMTPAGRYEETLTVADANGYTESKKFTFVVNHASRTLNLYQSRETLSGIETATIYPFVDSTTPLMDGGIIGSDGTINYSAGNSTGCTVTPTTGIVSPAFSGGTCLITAVVSRGTYYESANKSISFKIGGAVGDIAYFSSNDETATFNSISGAHNSIIKAPAALTRNNYRFLGWSISAVGESLISPGDDITLTSDKTYYAIWQSTLIPKVIKPKVANAIGDAAVIIFDTGTSTSGVPPDAISALIGDSITISDSATLNKPHYRFLGWKDANGTYQPGDSFTVTLALHTLTPVWAIDTFIITYNANGGLTDSTTTLAYGTDALETTPVVTKAGNTFVGWSLDSSTVIYTKSVDSDQTFYAVWSANPYAIIATSNGFGTIDSTPARVATFGESQTFTFTPNTDYFLQRLLIDGVETTPVSSYTFENISAVHTVNATFKLSNPTITITNGTRGTPSPGTTSVPYGTTQSFDLAPDADYHVETLTVDGVIVTPPADNILTFTNVTETHTVDVRYSINIYTITVGDMPGVNVFYKLDNASFTALPANRIISVRAGQGGTAFYLRFNAKAGYTLDLNGLVVDGYSDSFSDDGTTASPTALVAYYTSFTNPQQSHTLSFQSILDQFAIYTYANANGTVSPLGTHSIGYGSDDTITMIPNVGYHVSALDVDGSPVAPATTYVFRNITQPHSLTASFAIDTFTLVASSGANGSISSSGSTVLNYGQSKTYTFTPSSHYHVESVSVDGTLIGSPSTYTFESITANHTIAVSFVMDTFTINFAGNGGTGGQAKSFNYGTNALSGSNPPTVTRTGYTFLGWSASEADSTTILSSLNVTVDTSVYAQWSINSYNVTFNANSGTGGNTQSLTYNVNALSTAPTVTRTSYTFAGWSTVLNDVATKVDSYSVPASASTLYALWVNRITIGGGSNITKSYGFAESSTAFTAAGGLGAHSFRLSADQSANGITIDSNTGIVYITSTTPVGSYSLSVIVTDEASISDSKTIVITINSALTISDSKTLTTTVGRGLSSSAFTSAGGTGSKSYSISPSSAYVSINSSGVVFVDTSSAAMNQDFTVTVTDSSGAFATSLINVTVNGAAIITGSTTVNSTTGFVFTSPTYSTSGGTGSISLTNATSPAIAGITLVGGALRISDTVTVGTYTITLKATDSLGIQSVLVVTVNVATGITFTAPSNIATTKGYSFTGSSITPSGGTGTLKFSFSTSDSGIAINESSGVITVASGVNAGTYSKTIVVTDSAGATSSVAYSILVNPVVTVSGGSNVTTTAGRADSSTAFTATGGTPGGSGLEFSIPSAPSGVSIDATSHRVIVASSVVPGTYNLNVKATDSLGEYGTYSITIVVNQEISFGSSTRSLAVTKGQAWTFAPLTAQFGTGTLTYSLATPVSGVSIDTNSAQISVTSTLAQPSITFDVIAKDSLLQTKTITVTITINDTTTISGVSNIEMTQGQAFVSGSLSVTGGTGTQTFTLDPSANGNISINPATGVITVAAGISAGVYYDTIIVTDSVSAISLAPITITVNGPLTISGGSNITTTVSRADSSTAFTIAGGTGARTFAITGSTTGISIDDSGIVRAASNTPAGTYNETVSITDIRGVVATKAIQIIVNTAITFQSFSSLQTTRSVARTFTSVIVTGGTGPIVYTKTSNNGGITLNSSTGALTINGTFAPGNYYETVTATDAYGLTQIAPVTFVVNETLSITPVSTLVNTLGATSTFGALVTTGGTGSVTFSISARNAGYVTIESSTGAITISGTFPAGDYVETVTAVDSVGYTTTRVIAIQVNSSIQIGGGSATLATTLGRTAYSDTYTSTGGTGARSFSILPLVPGITIDSTTGKITVTGANVGTFTETVTLADSRGAISTSVIVITVNALATVTPITGLGTTFGRARTLQVVTVSGGTAPYTYSMLPLISNITLDTATGLVTLSSSLAKATYNESITVTDARGATVTKNVTITVNDTMTVSGIAAFTTTQGRAYTSNALTVLGGTGSKLFTISPTQTGLTINETTGAITTTGLAQGTYRETITVTDSASAQSTISFVITVSPPLVLSGGSAITTTFGRADSSLAFTVAGGTGADTFTITPFVTGISIGSDGIVRVTAAVAANTYYETVVVTDSLGTQTTTPITIVVNPGIAFNAYGALSSTAGFAYSFSNISALVGTGTGAIRYSMTNLNSFFSIDTTTGVISVSSSVTQGTKYETVTATDSLNVSKTTMVTFNIAAAMTFTGFVAPAATQGTTTLFGSLNVAGGTGTKVYSIAGQSNVTINSSTGAITVTTGLSAGSYLETITVTDSVGATSKQTFTLVIAAPMALTAGTNIITTQGRADSSTAVSKTGGTGTVRYSLASYATGITIETTTGRVIVSTLALAGHYDETIIATDSAGATASIGMTVDINVPVQVTGGNNIYTTLTRSDTTGAFTASGGTGALTLRKTSVNADIIFD